MTLLPVWVMRMMVVRLFYLILFRRALLTVHVVSCGDVGDSLEMMYSVLSALPPSEGLRLPERPVRLSPSAPSRPVDGSEAASGVAGDSAAEAAFAAEVAAFEGELRSLWERRQRTLKEAMDAIEVRNALLTRRFRDVAIGMPGLWLRGLVCG